MEFKTPLVHGILIKRYKRFLADIKLDNGEIIVAHCTNSGSMKSCIENGAEVYCTYHNDPKRKTHYTWEMIKINNSWVGVNTIIPNKLVYEAIVNNEISGLKDYEHVQREVKFNDSRFDVYCKKQNEECFVEVKNVTMKVGSVARFPDAITTRGQKHLHTLLKAKHKGYRAVMFYVVQRTDVNLFEPANDIDAGYAEVLRSVCKQGVEVVVMQAHVQPTGIKLIKKLPFNI